MLLGVAGLLSVAAALAIGILLFGDFGSTEGRILGTTAVLAGYGLLTLPAAMLQDQRRLPVLAAIGALLAATGATLAVTMIWRDSASEDFGNTIWTVTAALLATVQTSALGLRPPREESPLVRGLFIGSAALVMVVASMFVAIIWASIEDEGFIRVFAALLVLDVLLVALQPILSHARPQTRAHRLRVLVSHGEPVELAVEARDVAAAAERAIRRLEGEGRPVRGIEVLDEEERGATPSGWQSLRRSPDRAHGSIPMRLPKAGRIIRAAKRREP